MKDEKKSLRDFERFKDNPTSGRHKIDGLIIGSQHENKQGYIRVDEDSELVEDIIIEGWNVRVFDRFQFVKLFPDAQNELVKLSSAGIAVFSYIMVHLKKQQDQILINATLFGEWYKKIDGCSDANCKMICYRGIIDLLNHRFIFMKVGEGSYFINVNKFFNGKRLKIDWVDEINIKLKNGENVPKKAVAYDENYKKSKYEQP